tara:strand:+ start:595 stop:897 length:303 start_codon:yes stop_codon:yes gene_type:complete
MIDIAIAIHKINSNAGFVIRDNDVNQIEWADGTTPISKADIEAKQAELQTEYDAAKYQRDRKTEYPSIQDQLDMQYWDKKNGTTTWVDAVAKVKSDNPKP